MTILSFPEAAAAVGCSRQHLYRLTGKGRISVVSKPDGNKGIDTSELLRVFGKLAAPVTEKATGDSHPGDSRRQPVTEPETAASVSIMEVELRAAKDALRVAEERLREAHDREHRLLELLAAQTRMLENKPSTPAPAPAPTPAPPPAPGSTLGSRVSIPTLSEFFSQKTAGKR